MTERSRFSGTLVVLLVVGTVAGTVGSTLAAATVAPLARRRRDA